MHPAHPIPMLSSAGVINTADHLRRTTPNHRKRRRESRRDCVTEMVYWSLWLALAVGMCLLAM